MTTKQVALLAATITFQGMPQGSLMSLTRELNYTIKDILETADKYNQWLEGVDDATS